MRIGIFTETYKPTVNGVVNSVEGFRQQLEKKGHQYLIFAPNHSEADRQSNVYRFPSVQSRNHRIYPIALPMPFALAEHYFPIDHIKQLDIIHIQHFSAMGQYGLHFAKRFHIPSVYTYHTMAELYSSYVPVIGNLMRGSIRALTRHTAAQATHVITPTPSVTKYLRKIGITKPITSIASGIETSNFKRVKPGYVHAAYHIPEKHQIVVYAGRLAAEKNIEFLLQSFVYVHRDLPDTHLILAADGPDRNKVQNFIRTHQLEHNVTITGFLDHKILVKIMGAAQVFAFPSVTDTQGIVILEAMASGAVPVAIDRYGPHDLIKNGRTGFLTDLNMEQFAARISDLLTHQEIWQRMSMAAQHEAQKYDVTVTAEAMEKLYLQLLTK